MAETAHLLCAIVYAILADALCHRSPPQPERALHVATLPPKRADLENDAAAFQRANRLALRNTSVFNYLDAASISLPYFPSGAELPIGLMLSRPQGGDAALLQHACIVEAMLEG